MPPRKSAAPVSLAAGLPDQPRNGLGRIAPKYRVHRRVEDSVYAVVELTCKEVVFSYELSADRPTMQIASIQIPDDQALVEKILREAEAGQVGQDQIPYESPVDAQADHRAALQQAVVEWAGLQAEPARTLWETYFGEGAPAGPLGAELVHLVEFADHHGITASDDEVPETVVNGDDLTNPDGEDIAAAEDDARHAVLRTPATTVPEPEWSDG